ncbi:MAG: hypothetical protein JXX14_25215 [Deltaproteobacteria bacterium]|nr:hypothetical protein [Deltaproteobacteria bacterium]
MERFVFLIIILFQLCSLSPRPAIADDKAHDNNEAKKAFREGTTLFRDGKYILASEAFRKAYKYRPTWKLFFNIAQADAAASRYGLSLEAFEAYLALGGDEVPRQRMDEAMDEIARLRMLVGVLEVNAPDGAVIYVDSYERTTLPTVKPIRVAVGQHTVQIMINGEQVHEETVEIAGNLTASVVYPKPEEPAHTPVEASKENFVVEQSPPVETQPASNSKTDKRNKLLLISGISSAVLAAGGIAVGVIGSMKFSKDYDKWETASDAYRESGDASDYDDAHDAHSNMKSDSTILTAGFIAGGVFGTASIILFSVLKKKKESPVAVVPSAGSLTVTF